MSRITITCNKCEEAATMLDVEGMTLWNQQHICHASGGIIGQDQTGLTAHHCQRPSPTYPVGVIWQCGTCRNTYRIENVRDRGISSTEWVSWPHAGQAPIVNPDCLDGKHRACSGTGWDEALDQAAQCPCTCHEGTE